MTSETPLPRVLPVSQVLGAAALGDVVSMLVSASRDADLCDATYLPPRMGRAQATRWLDERPPTSWVVYIDETPAGWYELSVPKGELDVGLPDRTGLFEREVWLLPAHRGHGLIRQCTELLRPEFDAHGVELILGVAWETNTSAIRAMQHQGFKFLDRTWWSSKDATEQGWCEAWVLDLAAQR